MLPRELNLPARGAGREGSGVRGSASVVDYSSLCGQIALANSSAVDIGAFEYGAKQSLYRNP